MKNKSLIHIKRMLKGHKNKNKIEIQQGPLTDECIVFALNRITKQQQQHIVYIPHHPFFPFAFFFYYYLIHIKIIHTPKNGNLNKNGKWKM